MLKPPAMGAAPADAPRRIQMELPVAKPVAAGRGNLPPSAFSAAAPAVVDDAHIVLDY